MNTCAPNSRGLGLCGVRFELCVMYCEERSVVPSIGEGVDEANVWEGWGGGKCREGESRSLPTTPATTPPSSVPD